MRPGYRTAIAALALLASSIVPATAQEQELPAPLQAAWNTRYDLPPSSVQELFQRDKDYVVLENLSPDRRHVLVPHYNELSTVERMGQPTTRLAGLELRPQRNRTWRQDTYGVVGLSIYDLDNRTLNRIAVPDGFITDTTWSPDGSRVAFLWHGPEQTEVWTADVATARAERLSDAPVMTTLASRVANRSVRPSSMVQWTPDGTVITLLVPAERGDEPSARVATGPTVRSTRDDRTPTRTQPFLLDDATDTDKFRYHTTSQIAELRVGQAPQRLGEPAMYRSLAISPDGRYLLTEQIVDPLSPLTSYNGFAHDLEVLARDGAVVATVRQRPLREGVSGGDDNDLPRDVAWHPQGATLVYLQQPTAPDESDDEAAPQDTATESAPTIEDEVRLLSAPFDVTQARVLVDSEHGMRDVVFSADGDRLFVRESRDGDAVLLAYDVADIAAGAVELTAVYDPSDPAALPGDLLTRRSGNGIATAVVASTGHVFLHGDGFNAAFRPRPFIDRIALAGGTAPERVFEGSGDRFEQPVVPLDDNLRRMIVSREAVTEFPQAWLRSVDGDSANWEQLTTNTDPFPEITAAQRIDFEFERRDGLKVQARISMPVGWRPGDAPVPAIFWTYPREYRSARDYQRASMRGRNRNEFTHLSYLRWSDIWLSQGYALVYPDVPIVGDPYNDNFIQHLDDSVYGAIRKIDEMGLVDIDRIGHGGHSYGAFATANLLAHTPYFKAGIAGDGAYNRTLTPMSFQGERRYIWQAQDVYLEMSPFFQADHIDTPLLMYHGADDNNSGTWPIQSRRMIQALTGLGKTAVLYEYPYESHGPSAIESYLDLWKRWLDWFDQYVKNPPTAEEEVSAGRR